MTSLLLLLLSSIHLLQAKSSKMASASPAKTMTPLLSRVNTDRSSHVTVFTAQKPHGRQLYG